MSLPRPTTAAIQADAIHLPFADQVFDLVFGSPPYCDARTYGIGAQRDCQPWIDWMLDVTTECLRVTKGPVVWVAAGVTRNRNYWPACEGLMYEWWKRGGSMYRPCYWHRYGIPGNGGDDWFRSDIEHVMLFKRAGKLAWSNNTACGHKCRFKTGGSMSNRNAEGARSNESRNRRPNFKPYEGYTTPELANPGNLISTGAAGGHQLGDSLAHVNEAPFPEKLAERFILSLAPPGGKVLDPFSGSGTTKVVADRLGRIGVGSDIRLSQCQLTRTRWASDTKVMFA